MFLYILMFAFKKIASKQTSALKKIPNLRPHKSSLEKETGKRIRAKCRYDEENDRSNVKVSLDLSVKMLWTGSMANSVTDVVFTVMNRLDSRISGFELGGVKKERLTDYA